MKMLTIVTIVILSSVVLFTVSCASTPDPMSQSTPIPNEVEVVNIEEDNTVTNQITQDKTFDQCESSSPFKATIQFSQDNTQETQRELILTGAGGGEFGVSPVAKVVVQGSIERHFSSSQSSTMVHQEGVDIEVPAHTRQEYTIVWQEKIVEGTVQYEENGELKTAQYSYRIGVELASTKVNDLACDGGEVAEAKHSTPTPTPTSISQPTHTPSPTIPPAPTSTLEPTNTPTPIGMFNEVHQISGERTNGWEEADPDSWYSTSIYVQAGDQISIEYVSGEWWVGKVEDDQWVPQVPTDAEGYTGRLGEQVIAQFQAEDPSDCYELPSAPIGSLIGRIGEEGGQFLVGNSYENVVGETGILFLRMNYNCRRQWINKIVGSHCPVLSGGKISVRIRLVPAS